MNININININIIILIPVAILAQAIRLRAATGRVRPARARHPLDGVSTLRGWAARWRPRRHPPVAILPCREAATWRRGRPHGVKRTGSAGGSARRGAVRARAVRAGP